MTASRGSDRGASSGARAPRAATGDGAAAPGNEPGQEDAPPAPEAATPGPAEAPLEGRWWVEKTSKVNEKERRARAQAAYRAGEGLPKLPGAKLFRIGMDFDQDRARTVLTDTNLTLLREVDPPEGTWAYHAPIRERSPRDLVERVKRAFRIPRDGRGVIVDAGTSLRLIVTGAPFGARVMEVTLGPEPCLDAWVGSEWVLEKAFQNRERAIREAPRFLRTFFSPDREDQPHGG